MTVTISELKAISNACRTDAEFLAHPEVRRVYWKAFGIERWQHSWLSGYCRKCGQPWRDQTSTPFECSKPNTIPCSLPDAVERLREKVAENESTAVGAWEAIFALHELACGGGGSVDSILASAYLVNDARDRFLVFATALNGVTDYHKLLEKVTS